MKPNVLAVVLLSSSIGLMTTGIALADCESDLLQLEKAFALPDLTAAQKAALEEAKTKAVSALKKDDDSKCHTAIVEAMSKAGLKFQ